MFRLLCRELPLSGTYLRGVDFHFVSQLLKTEMRNLISDIKSVCITLNYISDLAIRDDVSPAMDLIRTMSKQFQIVLINKEMWGK